MRKAIKFSVVVFMAVCGLAGCKAKETAADAEAEVHASRVDTVVVVVENPVATSDSLLISFEKTPCFGRCPVYKIKVYNSGFATYEGLNFAERMGFYSTFFTREELDKIFASAEAVGYRNFDETYDDPRVTDLPSTISVLVFDGDKHRVKARIHVPETVKAFQENLAVSLAEKDWKPYSLR